MKTQNVRRGSWRVTVSLMLSLAVLGALQSPAAGAPPAAGDIGLPMGSAASWSDWVQTGTQGTLYDVAVGQNLDGRLEIFVNYHDGILHAWETAPNSNQYVWGNLGKPGDTLFSFYHLAVGWNLDGRQEIFASAAGGGDIWHKWQVAPSNGWSDWQSMGSIATDINDLVSLAVGRNQDGRMELFALGSSGREMWHKWQVAPNSGWSGWQSMGKPAGGEYCEPPVVGQNKDGRLMAFVVGGDKVGERELRFKWQTGVNNGWNSDWVSMGKPTGAGINYKLEVGQNQDGRAEVFAMDYDHNLWRKWQVAPNSYWSGWGNLGKPAGSGNYQTEIALGQNKDGRQEVFASSPAGLMWHKWQLTPNGGWSHWESLGEPEPIGSGATYPRVGRNLDGRLVLFAKTVYDDYLFHKWQTAPPVVLTLQQGLNGYAGVVDTWIDANAPDTGHPIDTTLAVRSDDNMASLLRFDLAGRIPEGYTINSATMMVYVEQTYNEGMPATVRLFKMLRWWTSDATWNLARMTVSWGMPGANDAGSDRGYRAVESKTWTSTGWKSFNVTGLVRTWYSNPASNKGVVIKAYGTDGMKFMLSSSQYRNLKLRPKLIINYAPTY